VALLADFCWLVGYNNIEDASGSVEVNLQFSESQFFQTISEMLWNYQGCQNASFPLGYSGKYLVF